MVARPPSSQPHPARSRRQLRRDPLWAGLRPLLREYPAGLLVAGARARALGLPWPSPGTVAWRAGRVLRRGGGGPGRPGEGCPAPLQSDPTSAAEWRDGVSESYLFVLTFHLPFLGSFFPEL